MTLSQDYASKIRRAADIFDRLDVDRRDPARYHEVKDQAVQELRDIANAVEIDQVFVERPGLPDAPPTFGRGSCHVVDRKGRVVQVETRRRTSKSG